MVNESPGEMHSVSVTWQLDSGPPPLVNQFVLQGVVDGDGGPGEIIVTAGYVAPPPSPPAPNGSDGPHAEETDSIAVTTVARFALTRHRAEQLVGYLSQQIAQWDQNDALTRGGDHDERA